MKSEKLLRKPKTLPSQARLKDVFNYSNGELYRKSNPRKRAGNYIPDWYARVSVDGDSYLLHRVVWKYFHGNDPINQIDHINGDKLDNRIENLREATHSQNLWNTYSKNSLGKKGIYYNKRDRLYYARIYKNGQLHYAGSYRDEAKAYEAVCKLRESVHGEYARN